MPSFASGGNVFREFQLEGTKIRTQRVVLEKSISSIKNEDGETTKQRILTVCDDTFSAFEGSVIVTCLSRKLTPPGKNT